MASRYVKFAETTDLDATTAVAARPVMGAAVVGVAGVVVTESPSWNVVLLRVTGGNVSGGWPGTCAPAGPPAPTRPASITQETSVATRAAPRHHDEHALAGFMLHPDSFETDL